MKEDKMIKDFFTDEVNMIKAPPMPHSAQSEKKWKITWDSMLMTACIFTCLAAVLLPASYDNAIRRSYVPMSKYEAFKERIPRVIFDASLYFKKDKAGDA